MKIIKYKKNIIYFGRIIIETSKGNIEFSYMSGNNYDDNLQIEEGQDVYNKLTDEEVAKIDNIINEEMYNKK